MAGWSGLLVGAASLRAGLYLVLGCSLGLGCAESEPIGDGMRGTRSSEGAGVGGGGSGPGGAGSSVIPGGQTMQPPPRPIAGAGAGGSPAAGRGGDCATITETAEVMRGAVDIVWIIDGSGSMLDEILAVEQNITNFANQIANAGIDHHVVMLATADVAAATPLGMDPAHYLYVPALVDSHNALQLLLDLYPQYAMFLRPDAPLHFVVVSDDESDLAADAFKQQMEMLAGKTFIFHAIASESVGGAPCVGACGIPIVCGGFAPGLQYYALADTTGGQKISICIADWSMVFGPLQDAVIASVPLPCDYPIPAPPTGETFDRDKVNLEYSAPATPQAQVFPRADNMEACGDQIAWFYDAGDPPTQIRMCPAACTTIAGGGTIQIKLGCNTVVVE